MCGWVLLQGVDKLPAVIHQYPTHPTIAAALILLLSRRPVSPLPILPYSASTLNLLQALFPHTSRPSLASLLRKTYERFYPGKAFPFQDEEDEFGFIYT